MEKTNKTLPEYLEWRKERGLSIRVINFIENSDPPRIAGGRRKY